MRICILNLLLILCCIILMIATHPSACSYGNTPLKDAIYNNKSDVVAYLRSIGAPALAAQPPLLRLRWLFVNFPCDIAVLRARAKRERRILISLHVKRSRWYTWQEGPKSALARCRLLP